MLIISRLSIVVQALVVLLVLSSAGSRADSDPGAFGSIGSFADKGSAQPLTDSEYQRIVKKIAEAIEDMKQAQQRIAKGDNSSVEKQRDAELKLIEARNKVEELLRQLRQKEMQQTLTRLINRCLHMLEEQEKVYVETKSLDGELQSAEDAGARKVVDQKSSDQSVAEKAIVKECENAIVMLESDATTVAFPECMRQLKNDMQNVEARLKNTDVGPLTQGIEEDIIQTLKEMIEDLKRARTTVGEPPGSGSPPPADDTKPKLMNEIAELRRLRSMQIRINNRTKIYEAVYPAHEQLNPERAKDAEEKTRLEQVQKELRELGASEAVLQKLTRDIAQGKNKP
jgi:hypothetical protein